MTMPEHGDPTPLYNEILEEFNKEARIHTDCRIHLAQLGNALFLNIIGTADKSGYQFLAEKAIEIINSGDTTSLIVDLSLCDRLSASPLGMIGLVLMTFGRKGGQVFVITRNESIIKSLKILGLHERCRIIDSVDQIHVE